MSEQALERDAMYAVQYNLRVDQWDVKRAY